MRTRRKSKAAVAVESDQEHDDEAATLNVEIPDDIDVDALQNILPDTSLASPSSDAIVSLYRLLLAQVEENDATHRELEEAQAEGERKDVELDQALQDKESQAKEYEASFDTLQNELKEVKQERDQFGVSPRLHFVDGC